MADAGKDAGKDAGGWDERRQRKEDKKGVGMVNAYISLNDKDVTAAEDPTPPMRAKSRVCIR